MIRVLISALLISILPILSQAEGLKNSTLDAWQAEPLRVLNPIELKLSDFLWEARPIIIFANTANDPRVETQLKYLLENEADLLERDIVIIVDTDPSLASELRLKLRPRDFQLVLIGKDGGVKLRKPRPWSMRELSRVIDKMPIRKQEIAAE